MCILLKVRSEKNKKKQKTKTKQNREKTKTKTKTIKKKNKQTIKQFKFKCVRPDVFTPTKLQVKQNI